MLGGCETGLRFGEGSRCGSKALFVVVCAAGIRFMSFLG
jgi:hypothetical protein